MLHDHDYEKEWYKMCLCLWCMCVHMCAGPCALNMIVWRPEEKNQTSFFFTFCLRSFCLYLSTGVAGTCDHYWLVMWVLVVNVSCVCVKFSSRGCTRRALIHWTTFQAKRKGLLKARQLIPTCAWKYVYFVTMECILVYGYFCASVLYSIEETGFISLSVMALL